MILFQAKHIPTPWLGFKPLSIGEGPGTALGLLFDANLQGECLLPVVRSPDDLFRFGVSEGGDENNNILCVRTGRHAVFTSFPEASLLDTPYPADI